MRENKIHKIEVHVATICFNEKDEVFIVKRSQNRNLYPGLWECGGGMVWPGENFEEAVKRETRDELGATVDILGPFGTYEIPIPETEQKKIPGIKFACRIKSFADGEPKLSEEHTEWRWVSMDKLDSVEFIKGLKKDITDATRFLRL